MPHPVLPAPPNENKSKHHRPSRPCRFNPTNPIHHGRGPLRMDAPQRAAAKGNRQVPFPSFPRIPEARASPHPIPALHLRAHTCARAGSANRMFHFLTRKTIPKPHSLPRLRPQLCLQRPDPRLQPLRALLLARRPMAPTILLLLILRFPVRRRREAGRLVERELLVGGGGGAAVVLVGVAARDVDAGCGRAVGA